MEVLVDDLQARRREGVSVSEGEQLVGMAPPTYRLHSFVDVQAIDPQSELASKIVLAKVDDFFTDAVDRVLGCVLKREPVEVVFGHVEPFLEDRVTLVALGAVETRCSGTSTPK